MNDGKRVRRAPTRHVCPNAFHGEGARGACYIRITATENEGAAHVDVGHSCVGVHDGPMPISWLSELVAIATAHDGGVAGFLKANANGDSYALACDPPSDNPQPARRRR